jgi:ATP adenylyltransferase
MTSPDLMDRIRAATHRARQAGVLDPIATELEIVAEAGICFQVWVLGDIARREGHVPESDPFLDPLPELVVADVAPHHRCLLNRFNVLPHHLLVVTRDKRPQAHPPERADFAALAACLADLDALAFYNAGRVAGASQEHRHFQLVPLPLGPDADLPLEPLFAAAGDVSAVPGLPFRHAFTRLDEDESRDGDRLTDRHAALRDACGLAEPHAPYNLLVTRRWMLLVPRRREHFAGASLNGLVFAGCLLVRDRDGLAEVRRAGPLRVLASVTYPRS